MTRSTQSPRRAVPQWEWVGLAAVENGFYRPKLVLGVSEDDAAFVTGWYRRSDVWATATVPVTRPDGGLLIAGQTFDHAERLVWDLVMPIGELLGALRGWAEPTLGELEVPFRLVPAATRLPLSGVLPADLGGLTKGSSLTPGVVARTGTDE